MTPPTLRRDVRGHVLVLTLDRPDRLNALDASLRDGIPAAFADAQADPAVRAIVVTGEGRGFSSGVDLSGPRPATEPASAADPLDELGWVGRQALAVHGCDKPTIAAVNGVAAGAGMSLALACDLRVGSAATRFRTVFLERNLSPDSGMSWFLPRIVGYSRAADLLFTSRDVGGEEAYRLGLLDRFVDSTDASSLVDEAVALATQISSLPPVAMRSAKRVLQHNLGVGLEEALRYEMAGLGYARKARNDGVEAMASFREKRPPNFTGT
ncbi:MAG TPA: enoyl-CoA hydratase/isomerase family protein [Acidimicrobiales bacterium]|nr:enoyl-CoA hydratase/isomerase family protein [Acidimicrobiales bacterium]